MVVMVVMMMIKKSLGLIHARRLLRALHIFPFNLYSNRREYKVHRYLLTDGETDVQNG